MGEKMEEVRINTEYITLDQLLKWANIVSTGGEGKHLIQTGQVKLNNQVETRRGKKVYPGDIVSVLDQLIKVTGNAD